MDSATKFSSGFNSDSNSDLDFIPFQLWSSVYLSLIRDRQPLARFVHCLGVIVIVVVVFVVVVSVSVIAVVDVLQIAIFKFLLCFILDCHDQYINTPNIHTYICTFIQTLIRFLYMCY